MPRRLDLTQDGEWLPPNEAHERTRVPHHTFTVLMTQSPPESEAETIHAQHCNDEQEGWNILSPGLAAHQTASKSTHAAFRAYKDLGIERSRVQAALDAGYIDLITLALEYEQEHCPSFGWADLDDRAGHMFIILLSIDDHILHHHIQGDFVQHYKQSPSFRKTCDDLQRIVENEQRPVVYRCTIADRTGRGHNHDELAICLQYMHGYATEALDIRTRRSIAQQMYTEDIIDVAAFERRINCTSETIKTFVKNAERRGTAHNAPMTYVGVTTDPSNRRATHEKGSHGLMALFLAVSKHLFPGKFELYWHPLFACFEPGQIASGEILFERLGCGLVATGGGFNCEPAGKAITARTGPSDQDWSMWTLKAINNAKFIAELAMVTEGCHKWDERKRVLRQQARRAGLAAYLTPFLKI